MATENLKFVLEGDVNSGLSGIEKVISAIDKLSLALSKSEVSRSVKKIDQQLGLLGQKKVDLKKLIVARDLAPDIAGVKNLTSSIEAAKQSIKELTTVQKVAPRLGVIGRLREEISAIKKDLNFQQSESSIASLNERLATLQAELKRVTTIGTKAKESIEEIAQPVQRLGILASQKSNLSELFGLRDAATTTRQIRQINSEIQKTQKSIASLTSSGTSLNRSLGLIGKRQGELVRLRNSLPNATSISQIKETNVQIARLENEVRALSRAGVPLSRGMGRLSKSSGAANFAVLSLSQGVQDASFGFIGIQNNITQFIQSFTQLKQETKSTKLAFKALGSTLLGPGGIFLAISAVISAFTYFSMRNRTATKEVKKLDDAVKSLRDSLQSVADTQGNATIKTAEQIAKLNTLYSIATDVNRSMKERIDSAGKLQDEFSDTFGSISKVNIISGEAAKTFDKLTQNILKAAKASAAFQQIVDNIKAIGKAQKEIDNARDPDKLKKLTENYIKAQKAFEASRGGTGILSQVTVKRSKDLEKARDALNNYSSGFSKYLDIISDAREENEKLTESIKGLNLSFDEAGSSTVKKIEELSDKIKDAFSVLDAMNAFYEKLKQINVAAEAFHWGPEKTQTERIKAAQNALQSLIDNGINPASEAFRTLQKYFDAFSVTRIDRNIIPSGIPTGGKVVNVSSGLNEKGFKGQAGTNTLFTNSKITESLKANAKATSEWAKSASVIEGLFTQIFENAAGGEDVFKSLARAVERLAIKLAAAAATATVLSALTGGASGALGGFAGIFKGILGFANGGFVQSPTLAVVGDDNTGGEWILNQNQMSALFESISQARQIVVTGELKGRGNELIGVLNSSQSRNRRIN